MVALRVRKTCDKLRERRKGNKISYFDELPNELISTVIARVASSSISNLCNAKLSCKTLRSVCEEGYVLKHATLEKIPVIPWPIEGSNVLSQISFVELCQDNGNPEALYRKGIVDFFTGGRRDSALECLKLAKECEHLAASYAIGIILILAGEKQKGMQQLGTLKKHKNLVTQVTKCRNQLKAIIGSMWINNDEIVREKPTCCSLNHRLMYKKGWCLEEDEEHIDCEACLCDIEIDAIFNSIVR